MLQMKLLLKAIVLISCSSMPIIVASVSGDLRSSFILFSFPVPLLNFGSSLLTAFSNWTGVPSPSPSPFSASASTAFSPTSARAYSLVPSAPALIPVIIPSAMTTATMRVFFIATMPVRAAAPASTLAMPSPVAPK